MSRCPSFEHLLVFPHLQVQNANAISSPLTHGFPSITAFLGLMWALQRKAQAAGLDVQFKAVGVVCHQHQELISDGGFISSLALSRNPIATRTQRKLIDKDGQTSVPAFIEEGRIHLGLSLLLAAHSSRWQREPEARQHDLQQLAQLLAGMRIAGGSLIAPTHPWQGRYQPWSLDLTGSASDRRALFAKARMRLLPGFCLIARDDLLAERQQQQPGNPLDAWLSLARINWHWAATEQGKGQWQHDRNGAGWIVPIPVGYGALGPLHPAGSVANARDASVPFHFVESLYSAGQWISPHRLPAAENLLWYADTQPEAGLYRCRNDPAQAHDEDELDALFEFDTTAD